MSHQREKDETCEAATLYGLGCLKPSEAKRVELRLTSGCPLCAVEVAESQDVADALALAASPQQPPSTLKSRLLESLASIPPSLAADLDLGRIVVRKDGTPWVASPMPGVEIRPLLAEKTFLLRISPGAILPEHHHYANEQCLVVEGSITDAHGTTVNAGDFVFMPARSTHHALHSEAGCVLLIAYS